MPLLNRPTDNPPSKNPRDGDNQRHKPSKWASSSRGPARGASGPWTRLKSAPRDNLTVYGFPSKGETRLNDFKTQEIFFRHIFERYMLFCHESRLSLAAEFSKLSIQADSALSRHAATSKPATSAANPSDPVPADLPPASAMPAPPTTATTHGPDASPELVLIHTAMRKLREAMLSSRRVDDFARSTYLFISRAAILSKSWESYLPALNYLTNTVHKTSPLSPTDWAAVTSYQILDLACRQRDFHQAYLLRAQNALADEHVDRILHALVRDDWVAFWNAKRHVDGYLRAIMEYAEEAVRLQALKALARSYFEVDRTYLERCAGKPWQDLVDEGVGWELLDKAGREIVVIRRPKRA